MQTDERDGRKKGWEKKEGVEEGERKGYYEGMERRQRWGEGKKGKGREEAKGWGEEMIKGEMTGRKSARDRGRGGERRLKKGIRDKESAEGEKKRRGMR